MPHNRLLPLLAAVLLLAAACIEDPDSMQGADIPDDDAGLADADDDPDDADGFQCDEGFEFCTDIPGGAACIDTTSDPDHCGGCGEPCVDELGPLGDMAPGTESICVDGVCDVGCISGYTECGLQCADLHNDNNHCGECHNACAEDQICIVGTCTIIDCPDDTTACADQCADLEIDSDHCGECDNACEAPPNADPICDEGTCSFECTDGATRCGDECVHTDDDPDHCGACGHRCLTTCGETQAGTCDSPTCDPQLPLTENGDGTADNPYTICTEEHLTQLPSLTEPDTYFVLTADITLTAPIDLIDDFDAILVGQGHTITHTATNVDAGLFATIESTAEVHNLTLQNVDIEGDDRTGGLARLNRGLITGTHVTGHISGGDETGGLTGRNQGGEIVWSTVGTEGGDDTVTGDRNVGGFVGYNINGAIIRHSHAYPTVEGDDTRIGGFAGQIDRGSIIEYSTAHGDVDGNDSGLVGGFAGHLRSGSDDWGSGQIFRCEAHGNVVTEGQGAGGLVGRMEDHASLYECLATGDVTNDFSDTGGLVGLVHDNSQIIGSEARGDIHAAGNNAGGLAGRMRHNSIAAESSANGNIYNDSQRSGGLVGILADKAQLTACQAHGDVHNESTRTGGLVGKMINATKIADSAAYGDVIGDDFTGGLVGRMIDDSLITNSRSEAQVTGDGDTGGLVGEATDDASVLRCSAAGAVHGDSDNVGGLAGRTRDNTTIRQSYATGDVYSEGSNIGGLVGGYDGNFLRDSYATGNVTGESSVGGLVGAQNAAIHHCYATGEVTGDDSVGGLVGDNGDEVVNSYWDVQTSGTGESEGGEFLVTEDFADQSQFQSWNFFTVWQMPTEDELEGMGGDEKHVRPRLRWEFK